MVFNIVIHNFIIHLDCIRIYILSIRIHLKVIQTFCVLRYRINISISYLYYRNREKYTFSKNRLSYDVLLTPIIGNRNQNENS